MRTLTLLLDRGADPRRGQLICHAAGRGAEYGGAAAALAMLLERDASSGDDDSGRERFDLNARMYDSDEASRVQLAFMRLGSLLHFAAEAGDGEAVEFLISKGADPRLRDPKGRTPRDCAALKGFVEVEDLLAKAEAEA